jgi:hypothetical protein
VQGYVIRQRLVAESPKLNQVLRRRDLSKIRSFRGTMSYVEMLNDRTELRLMLSTTCIDLNTNADAGSRYILIDRTLVRSREGMFVRDAVSAAVCTIKVCK